MKKIQRYKNFPPVIILSMIALLVFNLLSCGENLDEELVQAAKKGKAEKIENLLKKGADVNAKDRKHKSTVLMWAAHEGHIDAMKVLIRNGAEIGEKRDNGETALWFASQKGKQDT